jgi:cardiolipin synthase
MPGFVNAANLLTILRLALVPFIIQAILDNRHTQALALFGAAAFTDILDGAIARRYGLATSTGAYLDPIADKFLLSGMVLALGASGLVPWWFVTIVIGRDLYLLLAVVAVMALTRLRKFPPSIWGKVSTFIQVATVSVCLTRNILEVRVLDALLSAMLWVCAVFTIWSALHYTLRGLRAIRQR